MTNYLDLSIIEINKLLKDKKIRPLDLVMESLEKIEKYKDINAIITVNKEEAIKVAKELEGNEVDNLLFGIPILIKDNIVTKNLRTTCASHMLDNFIPIYDATVIEKIKEKNMIIIGKTNMDEFAMGSSGETSYFKPTLNPWNKTKITGGSSSGSAASVSLRMVPLALGSDTGGSIRQPASFCGVVGLKPTYGRISRYGLVAFSSSLDHIGPMTRNVYDNALLLNAISGSDDNDLTAIKESEDFTRLIGKDISGLKIAIPKSFAQNNIDSNILGELNKVIDLLKRNNVTVDYIDIKGLENSIPLYQIIALGEASSNLARFDGIKYGYKTNNYSNLDELYCNTRSEGFGEEVKRRIMIGSYVLSGKNANVYYNKALSLRKHLSENINEVFTNYDLIIGPVTTSMPGDIGSEYCDALKTFYDDLLTNPFNMSGNPCLSLPIGFINNMPVGIQIASSNYNEALIYQLSSFIEHELNLDLNPCNRGDNND